jgi:hypothetical protein
MLLDAYAEIFADNVSFPPPRLFHHSIPLIPGSRPVNIRPYRYAPALKDEIERQVRKCLQLVSYNLVTTLFIPCPIGKEKGQHI